MADCSSIHCRHEQTRRQRRMGKLSVHTVRSDGKHTAPKNYWDGRPETLNGRRKRKNSLTRINTHTHTHAHTHASTHTHIEHSHAYYSSVYHSRFCLNRPGFMSSCRKQQLEFEGCQQSRDNSFDLTMRAET